MEEDPNRPKMNKTIFLMGDATLVLMGLILAYSIEGFTTPWVILCLFLGSLFGSVPYLIEYFTEKQFLATQNPRAYESLRHTVLQIYHQVQDLEEGQKNLTTQQKELTESHKTDPNLQKDFQSLNEKYQELQNQLKEQKEHLDKNIQKKPSLFDSTPSSPLLNRAFTQNTDLKNTGKWDPLIPESDSSSKKLQTEPNIPEQIPTTTPKTDQEKDPLTPSKKIDQKPTTFPEQEEWFSSETTEPTPGNPLTTIGTTSLLANIVIGIGNKPYLRGEGGGLSWKKGIPMNFKEIGQWQWQSPNDQDTITCQIYKNDQTPSQGEKIILQPGQNLEINPVF